MNNHLSVTEDGEQAMALFRREGKYAEALQPGLGVAAIEETGQDDGRSLGMKSQKGQGNKIVFSIPIPAK